MSLSIGSRVISKFKSIHETNECEKMLHDFNAEVKTNSNDSGEGYDSDKISSFYSGMFF